MPSNRDLRQIGEQRLVIQELEQVVDHAKRINDGTARVASLATVIPSIDASLTGAGPVQLVCLQGIVTSRAVSHESLEVRGDHEKRGICFVVQSVNDGHKIV